MFEEWDEEQFETLLVSCMESGEKYLSIRCSDAGLYRQVKELLISDQKIFDCMERSAYRTGTDAPTQVSYFENKDFNILTFMWK